MGFLVSANSRTRAGWFDDFNRPIENPVKRPWVHLGDGTPADINNLQELHLPQNSTTTNGGGESYAYQPKTPNWGWECSIWWPVGGAGAQSCDFYFTDSWTVKGAAFQNCVGVRLFYRIAAAGGQNIYIGQFPAVLAAGSLIMTAGTPVDFTSRVNLILKVLVEDDRWVRVYLNDTYVGSATVDNSYRFNNLRRCLRTMNGSYTDIWMQWMYHYDRPATIPDNSIWNSIFYDNFDGRSGNQNGVNGWSQFGTQAGVSSNSWAMTGLSDGSNMLLRNTGITNGRMRIVATTGGAAAPNNNRDSSLILCANSNGTQGLSANFYANKIYLSRWTSGGPTGPSYNDFTSRLGEVTVPNNTQVAFNVFDGIAWMEINGDRALYATVAGAIPATNPYAGLRVSRSNFTNSSSWNDVRIYGT